MDRLSIVRDLQFNLCHKLDDVSVTLTQSSHLMTQSLHSMSNIVAPANIRYQENSFGEQAKCW